MDDYTLSDELEAVRAIYGDEILTRDGEEYTLEVPETEGVQVRLHFPAGYPASPPRAGIVVSSGNGSSRGFGHHVVEAVQHAIERAWEPGMPILHPLLEELREAKLTSSWKIEDAGRINGETIVSMKGSEPGDQVSHGRNLMYEAGDNELNIPPPAWIASAPTTEKKSTFIAHATTIAHPSHAKPYITALVASDKRFEKATHNISAFRGAYTVDGKEIAFQDCDDDGEDAAGGRLLHLLELAGARNVLVVVSRWYGGVKLGPDRFRIINQLAREALVGGGWVSDGSKRPSKNKG